MTTRQQSQLFSITVFF